MEQCCLTDECATLLERGTVGKLGVFQGVEVGTVGVDERLVGQGPELFSRLQFR